MNKTKVLIHCDTSELVADLINGVLITLPPSEPVELDEFIANAVLEHKAGIHGIVECNVTRTKTGIVYDVDEALERAEVLLKQCEDNSINFYVRQQMEDRVASGKQPLPPTGRALEIIKRRKISLRNEYGLVPVGWRDPGVSAPYAGMSGETTVQSANQAIVTQLELEKQKNVELKATVEDLSRKFDALLKTLGAVDEPTVTDGSAPDPSNTNS